MVEKGFKFTDPSMIL